MRKISIVQLSTKIDNDTQTEKNIAKEYFKKVKMHVKIRCFHWRNTRQM